MVDQSKVPEQTVSYKADDEVGIIVQMDESTLLDTYLASPDKYDSYQDFLTSYEGKKAAQNLKDKQNALFNKIARKTDAKLACNYVTFLTVSQLPLSTASVRALQTLLTAMAP